MTPKTKEIQAITNKWNLIKLKSFAQKRKPSAKWKDNLLNEKTSLNDMTEELVSKHKQLTRLNVRKTHNSTTKHSEDPNRHVSKGDLQIANRHKTRCSATLIIIEKCKLKPQ